MAWSLYVKTDLGANQRCRDTVCRRLEVPLQLRLPAGKQPVRPVGKLRPAIKHLLGVSQTWTPSAPELLLWSRSHPFPPRESCATLGGAVIPAGSNKALPEAAVKKQLVAAGPWLGLPGGPAWVAELCQRFLVCWVAGRGHGAGGFHPVLCGSATTSEKEGRKGGSQPLSWLVRGRMTKSSKCSEHIGSPGKVWKMGGRKNHCPTKHLDAGSWEWAGGAAEEECRACLKSPSSREENLQQEAKPGI